MPYAQKTCLKCGTTHNKRGPYCSRSCGNVRTYTEETKALLSKATTEYHLTPEGAATRDKSSRIMSAKRKGEEWEEVGVDDFAVRIPDVTDYSAEFDHTWDRAEKW